MYEYLEGKIAQLQPTQVVIDIQGVGYSCQCSLLTYEQLLGKTTCKLLIHFVVREDAMLLYGFASEKERVLFRHLISVGGIGPNIARQIQSSMDSEKIRQAIASADMNFLKTLKGIGPKTAQRIIVELQDVILKEGVGVENVSQPHNKIAEDALNAMIALGFAKPAADKAIRAIMSANIDEDLTVEQLIKMALRAI